MGKDVIIALDFDSAQKTFEFLDGFGTVRPYVKIGMELFYSEGIAIVKELKRRGHKVFLDLKLHDIPNTVRKTMSVLSLAGADMCNLHAGGGSAMMKAAIEGLTRPDGTRPLLIAVTQLTSTDENQLHNELLIPRRMEDVVASYALNARDSGLDGVVCSPLEAERVHGICGESFLTITPGIRFDEGSKGDQSRVATPASAKKMGADYIVVGRPVTSAADPVAAYRRCLDEFI